MSAEKVADETQASSLRLTASPCWLKAGHCTRQPGHGAALLTSWRRQEAGSERHQSGPRSHCAAMQPPPRKVTQLVSLLVSHCQSVALVIIFININILLLASLPLAAGSLVWNVDLACGCHVSEDAQWMRSMNRCARFQSVTLLPSIDTKVTDCLIYSVDGLFILFNVFSFYSCKVLWPTIKLSWFWCIPELNHFWILWNSALLRQWVSENSPAKTLASRRNFPQRKLQF